jgi:hypothetical protein
VSWDIQYHSTGITNLKKGRINFVLKKAMFDLAVEWARKCYPKRFTEQNRYHLKDRTYKYKRNVKNKYPSWKPLVKTGALKEMTTENFKVHAVASKGDIKVKVTFRRPHPTDRFVSEELVKVLKKNMKVLYADMKRNLARIIREEPGESFKNGRTSKKGTSMVDRARGKR